MGVFVSFFFLKKKNVCVCFFFCFFFFLGGGGIRGFLRISFSGGWGKGSILNWTICTVISKSIY